LGVFFSVDFGLGLGVVFYKESIDPDAPLSEVIPYAGFNMEMGIFIF